MHRVHFNLLNCTECTSIIWTAPSALEITKGITNMCKVISVINNKDGVGKTTSTAIISEILAYLGQRVLVIDLDQQANLSMLLNSFVEDSEDVINGLETPKEFNIAELFKYRYRTFEEVSQLIRKTPIRNIDIIPASKRHKHTPSEIAKSVGNNNVILKRALSCMKDNYDYILIDNAPANDILTVNSMFVSDLVFVPVRVESFSYKGLKETMNSILYIKQEHDIDTVEFAGAFITQAELNTNIYKGIDESYQSELGNKFLRTPIRKDTKISELETTFKPALEYCPNSNFVYDYSKLILEMDILSPESKLLLEKSIGLS